MSLFSKIMDKLGIGISNESHRQAAPDSGVGQHPVDSVVDSDRPNSVSNATTTPSALSQVDVQARLDAMAAGLPQPLHWRTSIVDLLKLLGLDSSLEARKSLAVELGCPPDKMEDSAQMNSWLHRTVMLKLAEHGGTVPPELHT